MNRSLVFVSKRSSSKRSSHTWWLKPNRIDPLESTEDDFAHSKIQEHLKAFWAFDYLASSNEVDEAVLALKRTETQQMHLLRGRAVE